MAQDDISLSDQGKQKIIMYALIAVIVVLFIIILYLMFRPKAGLSVNSDLERVTMLDFVRVNVIEPALRRKITASDELVKDINDLGDYIRINGNVPININDISIKTMNEKIGFVKKVFDDVVKPVRNASYKYNPSDDDLHNIIDDLGSHIRVHSRYTV